MAGKLLAGVGIAALLGVGAAGVAALAIVKQRITLVVQDEAQQTARGPDPMDLLRADVAGLREDLGALSEALGPQLGQLHEALDTAAIERAQATAATLEKGRGELAALAARVEALHASSKGAQAEHAAALSRVERSLAQVQESSAAAAIARASEAAAFEVSAKEGAVTEPSAADSAPSQELAAVVTPPVTSGPAPVAAPEPTAEVAPKRSFLSFSLPSQKFSFEGRQRLAIVPSLSRVGFDAKSTLHDFSGVTQKVEGELDVDLAAPQSACNGVVRVEAKTLDTGMADRDQGLRELLGVEQHARLTFVWTSFREAKVDLAGQRSSGVAVGRLSIRGVEREVAMPVRVSVDASKRVAIDGELSIKLRDFGLEPPSQLGVISVDNELKIWIALRARSLGEAPASKLEADGDR